MFPARLFRAFANEDVRRSVLLTPLDIVLVMVSLLVKGGRPDDPEKGWRLDGWD